MGNQEVMFKDIPTGLFMGRVTVTELVWRRRHRCPKCSDQLEYIYHTWWKCRFCGLWQQEKV